MPPDQTPQIGPGAQNERTRLAWIRTSLSIAGTGLPTTRLAVHLGFGFMAVEAMLALCASIGLIALSWHRYRRGAAAFTARRTVVWLTPVLASVVTVTALGTSALTLLVLRVLRE
jgi:uncharacterized membrane protein YidH (DUF202 family)